MQYCFTSISAMSCHSQLRRHAAAKRDNAGTFPVVRQLEVDVAIIGGGSSGMYSATRLHQMNKTVVVVEPRNQTGGHVDTFTDPVTGSTFDVGVLYYHNISVVTNFADYLGIPMAPVSLQSSSQNNTFLLDFTTASIVPPQDLAMGDPTSAFLRYYEILSQYPYLVSGFHLPSPVPPDFYLPWGQYISKYNLTGLAFDVDIFNQGWAHILGTPTLYILKGFGQLLLQSFFSGFELATARHNNQELFDAAADKIGPSSLLLNSRAERIQRSDQGVKLTVRTPHGREVVKAKKLLITAPPLLSVLDPFLQLDDNERNIFGRFTCGYYWPAVVRDAGIPANVSIFNADPANPYDLADQPGIYTVIPSGVADLHLVYFGSPHYIPEVEVEEQILASISMVSETLGYNGTTPSLAYIRSHAPYHCTVTGEDIKGGFYDRLNALQGSKSTWYNGAAFQGHDSGSIWLYTENEILPALLG